MNVRMIKIRDLMQGYLDSGESGIVGYDGKLNIRPAYQCEFIYNEKQRNARLSDGFYHMGGYIIPQEKDNVSWG